MNRVLLDFDGVVFNNKKIHEQVKQQSIRFLKHKKNISHNKAVQLNNSQYPLVGHTALIIDNDYNTIQEYNNYVFDNDMMKTIQTHMNEHDINIIQDLIKTKQKYQFDFILCTNAPFNYCEQILHHANVPFDILFSTQHIYTSDNLKMLKPTYEYYSQIEKELVNTIHFIDDSFTNIEIIQNNPRWSVHHFHDEQSISDYLSGTKGIRTPADKTPNGS